MKKIIEFYSEGTNPSNAITPMIRTVAERLGVEIQTINITNDEILSKRYNITKTPTVIIVEDNNEIYRFKE